MVTLPRYNEPAVVTICIGYILACNARYMAAKACGDGRPHGTATFEGGVLGDELEVSKLGIRAPGAGCLGTITSQKPTLRTLPMDH